MTTSAVDGLVLVDKPAGVSSHDMVLAVRRACGERRVGHAGTLDPFATGLLVLLLGRATRLLKYLPGEPKVYDARIVFGNETDTEDLLGVATRTAPLPTRRAVLAAFAAATGAVSHVPPAFSAKRVAGRRAYALARAGQVVELAPVTVHVHGWDVSQWHGDADAVEACDARVTCGGGTYVRALARDVGRAVESAAHLGALRRVASGPFSVADAVTLGDLREGIARVRPPLDALPHLARQTITPDELRAVVMGRDIAAASEAPLAALVSDDTHALVAVAERAGDRWQPRVVMRRASAAA